MKLTSLLATLAIPLMTTAARAETEAEKAQRMEWFNDARFGMFIHWGLYSEAAGNFKGKPVPGAGEWLQSGGAIPAADYRTELLPKFNPTKYDPEAWVIAAKNAGMKYIVITSKHHDGFCLWDSKLTDWDVGSSPYHKDLLKPLAEACEKHGVKFCLYHSIMDWSHPDWGTKAPWRGNASNPQPDMDKFTAYLKGQLKEIVTDYHPGIIWFDGEWEAAWTHERGADLYDYLRDLDPKLIINNRVDKGRKGMEGHTTDPKFKGDYGTPEQQIPATGFAEGEAWESCMTMNGTWGFKTADTGWKSTETLVRNLIDIASKGGNYLLNVGPTGEGEIPSASLERLAAIGDWMKVNGESIHGTTASLFPKVSWNGRSTTRRNPDGSTRIYLHVFAKPADGKITVRGLVNRPDSAAVLGQSDKLEVTGKEGEWAIPFPSSATDPIATVIALTIKGKPEIREIAAEPDANGVLNLSATDAKLQGGTIKLENDHIDYWIDAKDSISWKANLPAGTYKVAVEGASKSGTSELELAASGGNLRFPFTSTDSWSTFAVQDAGLLKLAEGAKEITLKAVSKQGEGFLNLRSITLTKQP
ncbi:MAG: alpha-L-fucosidase [Luteolibacter sp.]